jgi:tetratricopeptide (TPR) repeat protein
MASTAVGDQARYRAFISYSHKDAAFGRRLHRRLEAYRLPRRLVGRDAQYGPVPERIGPIFRDLDELPAATDLSVEVREALSASASLIVVCSPAAAASLWVSREVEVFRALHPDRPILAAIVAAEPPRCFPAVLLSGGQDSALVEPLAADFREKSDGSGLAFLKLAAGILGLGLDELVQRDAQRKTRRVTAITAAALAAVLVMSALTLVALNARSDAVRQRGQAEGLVEFMLTDLRDKLKGVGRLDVMTAVNQRALHYYTDEDLGSLSVDSLERRARILHAMGEDDETRGDHDGALTNFGEARRTTAALMAKAPNDPSRIFAQAQSEYYFGSVDYARGRFAAANSAFERYKRLADRLVTIAPENPIYRREVGYAESNLCAIALKPPRDIPAAIAHCTNGLGQMTEAARRFGPRQDLTDDLFDLHGWLADAYFAEKDYARASTQRHLQENLLQRRLVQDPKNMEVKASWITLQIALALLEEKAGQPEDARDRLRRADTVLGWMISVDPANKDWLSQKSWVTAKLSQIH